MNFFVNKKQIEDEYIYIRNSDVNHIKNVLRMREGDYINIVCDMVKYRAQIDLLNSEFVKCKIIEKQDTFENEVKLTIFQGLAKADKIEYIIQKCTELGVFEIIPVQMRRCVVKLDDKDRSKKIGRWQKIAEVASKQSLRNEILKVDKILDFKQMCEILPNYDCVLLAYEKEKDITLKKVIRNEIGNAKNIAVIVGPEGGIDDEEVASLISCGAKSVTLGSRILRTETAPIMIASIIMYEFGK